MTDLGDRLVSDYLAQVEVAAGRLPSRRRSELLRDLGEHISAARAELSTESEVEIRNLLDRLGQPESIAEAAAVDTVPPEVAPSGHAKRRIALWLTVAFLVVAALALAAFFTTTGATGASGTGHRRDSMSIGQ